MGFAIFTHVVHKNLNKIICSSTHNNMTNVSFYSFLACIINNSIIYKNYPSYQLMCIWAYGMGFEPRFSDYQLTSGQLRNHLKEHFFVPNLVTGLTGMVVVLGGIKQINLCIE